MAFLGSSKKVLERLPSRARDSVLIELQRIKEGRDPKHWKPMATIGSGVREIRIRTGRQFRVIYLATLPDAIYVLHVFEKKTQKTAGSDIALARARLRTLLHHRGND